jgi:predicted metal-binding membrane protein
MRTPIVPKIGCVTMINTRTDPNHARELWFYVVHGLIFAVSVAATIYFCRSMSGGMDMPGNWTMSMMWMRMPDWTWPGSAAMFLLMWLAMMVAMMLPSMLPMLLSFRRSLAVTSAFRTDSPTVLVACGYFAVWMAIGVFVYVLGVSWAFATMHWPALSRAVPGLTGAALILAGAFQFTRWKMVGLCHCRDPLACSTTKKCSGQRLGWSHGFRQGIFCGICCAGPMLALLALGAMNLFVMFAIAVVIALEKLLPRPQPVVYLTGVLAVVAGTVIMVRSLF